MTVTAMRQTIQMGLNTGIVQTVAKGLLISFTASLVLGLLVSGGVVAVGLNAGIAAIIALSIHHITAPLFKKMAGADAWPWWMEVVRRVVVITASLLICGTFLAINFTPLTFFYAMLLAIAVFGILLYLTGNQHHRYNIVPDYLQRELIFYIC